MYELYPAFYYLEHRPNNGLEKVSNKGDPSSNYENASGVERQQRCAEDRCDAAASQMNEIGQEGRQCPRRLTMDSFAQVGTKGGAQLWWCKQGSALLAFPSKLTEEIPRGMQWTGVAPVAIGISHLIVYLAGRNKENRCG